MKKLLGFITLFILCLSVEAQQTVVNNLQVNSAKGVPPSQVMPLNGGVAYLDVNGILRKSTALALLGSKVTNVAPLNDSTLTITTDNGSTTVLVRGLFTLSRQRWFDSLRLGLIKDTINVQKVGAGFGSVYSNTAGTAIQVRGIQGSTTVGVVKNNDSSLTVSSLLSFIGSVTTTGGNSNQIALVGDVDIPVDGTMYGKIGGAKGWFALSQFPVVNTSTNTNGLISAQKEKRLDSTIKVVNYTLSGTYDPIVTASPTLDSMIFLGIKVRGATNSGLSVTNQGGTFANDYVIDLSATTWLKGQAGTATKSGDGSTLVFTIAHGLTGVTSASPVIVTPRLPAAAGAFYVTVDATNITLTYSSAPASGTNNLSWNYVIKP